MLNFVVEYFSFRMITSQVQPHYPVERSKNHRKMSSNEQNSTA